MRQKNPIHTPGPADILQGLRSCRGVDPAVQAIYEAARRLLGGSETSILLPIRFSEDAEMLRTYMMEHLPKRVTDLVVNHHDIASIVILNGGDMTAQIGGSEPPPHAVWSPINIDSGWGLMIDACKDLLSSGYPGCRDCTGMSAEPWNEIENRKGFTRSHNRH